MKTLSICLALLCSVVSATAQRYVRSFPTIDALLAATPNDVSTNAWVSGRNAPGDGGDGPLYYVASATTTTNLGTVHKPNNAGGRWYRPISTTVNALWFGADPNKVKDSTAALRDALLFCDRPLYGWGATAGEGYLAYELYIPPGAYITSGTLTNYGVAVRGKAAQRAGNYTCETTIHHKALAPLFLFTYGGNSSGTGANDYRCGSVQDLIVVGYAETYTGPQKAITSVTNRTKFFVAPADVPTLDMTSFPEMNWCFFYSNEGQYLGAGQIASVVSGTGEINLVAGTDVYSTVGGSDLRTVDKVVWSPISAGDEGSLLGILPFVDPAGAGPTAFWIKSGYGSVGNGPRIENVLINGFHVGIRVGPSVLERRQINVKILSNKFAGVLFPREFNATDSPWTGFTYFNGFYRPDYGATYVNTIVNPSLQNCTFGFFGLGPLERVQHLLLEAHSYAQLAVLRTLGQHIDYAMFDLCVRHGLIVYRGYNASAPSSIYDSTLSFGSLSIRTPLPGSSRYEPDPIHPTDRSAVYIPNTDPAFPVFINANQFGVSDGNSGDFQNGWDIASAGASKVTLGAVTTRNGATTNWVKAGSTKPRIVEVSDKFTVAEIGTGLYAPSASQIAMAINGTNTLAVTSTGSTFTTQTATPAITITRQDTGKTYSVTPGTDTLVWNNDSQNRAFGVWTADTTLSQLTIGHSATANAARDSYLQGEALVGAGTDISPGDLVFVGSRGTGAGNSKGRLIFMTSVTGTSSGTTQGTANRLIIQKDGAVSFVGMATDPAAFTGSMYYNTVDSGFRIHNGSTWKKVRVGVVLKASASLNFPSTAAQADSDLTITVTGAVAGDVVHLGIPPASVLAGGTFTSWVSVADTVTVRFSNYSAAAKDPPVGTFTVAVEQY